MNVFYEDFEIGETIVLGAHKFECEAMIAFAQLYDPQPFHLDEEAAKTTIYGSLIASGWHTASAFMRCFVEWLDRQRRESAARGDALPAVGVSPGISDLRWPAPVRAGDTVTYAATVLSKRAIHRPGWGLITRRNIGVNQKGVEVLSFTSMVMTARRPA
jgi:acyl dehydratase